MRFLIFGAVFMTVILVTIYAFGKKAVDGYVKYYRLGASCYDRDSLTFNDVLDRDVISSEDLTSLELMAYTKGRESAEEKYLKAKTRYETFVKK